MVAVRRAVHTRGSVVVHVGGAGGPDVSVKWHIWGPGVGWWIFVGLILMPDSEHDYAKGIGTCGMSVMHLGDKILRMAELKRF